MPNAHIENTLRLFNSYHRLFNTSAIIILIVTVCHIIMNTPLTPPIIYAFSYRFVINESRHTTEYHTEYTSFHELPATQLLLFHMRSVYVVIVVTKMPHHRLQYGGLSRRHSHYFIVSTATIAGEEYHECPSNSRRHVTAQSTNTGHGRRDNEGRQQGLSPSLHASHYQSQPLIDFNRAAARIRTLRIASPAIATVIVSDSHQHVVRQPPRYLFTTEDSLQQEPGH
jgi:hypothetical protein